MPPMSSTARALGGLVGIVIVCAGAFWINRLIEFLHG